jgi:hypothetical protein
MEPTQLDQIDTGSLFLRSQRLDIIHWAQMSRKCGKRIQSPNIYVLNKRSDIGNSQNCDIYIPSSQTYTCYLTTQKEFTEVTS